MENDAAKNRRALKALIDANNVTAQRIGATGYVMPLAGKLRDWSIRAHIHNGWLSFNTYFMQIPPQGSLRSAVVERMLEVNNEMSIAKFGKSEDVLTVCLEYRREHVDAAAFVGLLGLVHSVCERHYPEFFRIATGDAALEQLELAFNRPALPAD